MSLQYHLLKHKSSNYVSISETFLHPFSDMSTLLPGVKFLNAALQSSVISCLHNKTPGKAAKKSYRDHKSKNYKDKSEPYFHL